MNLKTTLDELNQSDAGYDTVEFADACHDARCAHELLAAIGRIRRVMNDACVKERLRDAIHHSENRVDLALSRSEAAVIVQALEDSK